MVDTQINYIPVKKTDIQAIDYLVKIGRGKQTVSSAHDWMILAKVFEFWTRRWPDEWQEFAKTVKDIKATRLNSKGTSASGEIKYVGVLPPRFERLIKVIFPMQEFNKEFVYKLTRNIKITKVGEKNDAWFTIPS
jgi:hypothetical protein